MELSERTPGVDDVALVIENIADVGEKLDGQLRIPPPPPVGLLVVGHHTELLHGAEQGAELTLRNRRTGSRQRRLDDERTAVDTAMKPARPTIVLPVVELLTQKLVPRSRRGFVPVDDDVDLVRLRDGEEWRTHLLSAVIEDLFRSFHHHHHAVVRMDRSGSRRQDQNGVRRTTRDDLLFEVGIGRDHETVVEFLHYTGFDELETEIEQAIDGLHHQKILTPTSEYVTEFEIVEIEDRAELDDDGCQVPELPLSVFSRIFIALCGAFFLWLFRVGVDLTEELDTLPVRSPLCQLHVDELVDELLGADGILWKQCRDQRLRDRIVNPLTEFLTERPDQPRENSRGRSGQTGQSSRSMCHDFSLCVVSVDVLSTWAKTHYQESLLISILPPVHRQ